MSVVSIGRLGIGNGVKTWSFRVRWRPRVSTMSMRVGPSRRTNAPRTST